MIKYLHNFELNTIYIIYFIKSDIKNGQKFRN
jgi:hypothetical protein